MDPTIKSNVDNNDDKLTENLFGTIVKPTMCKKTVIEFITKGDKTYVTKFQGQTEAECTEDELKDKTPVLDNNGNPDPAAIKEAKEMYELAEPEPVIVPEPENAEEVVEKDGEVAVAVEEQGEAVVEEAVRQGAEAPKPALKLDVKPPASPFVMNQKTLDEGRSKLKPTGKDLNGGKRNTKKSNKDKKGGKGKKSKKVSFAISKKQRKARRNATHRK